MQSNRRVLIVLYTFCRYGRTTAYLHIFVQNACQNCILHSNLRKRAKNPMPDLEITWKMSSPIRKSHVQKSVFRLKPIKTYRIKLNCQNAVTSVHVQQMPQLQPSVPLQNNYVYITECNPSISSIQDVNKQFGNEITSLVATQPIQSNALTYNLNSMGILEGLTNNGYAIQHLNVPAAVQYQTFSVPMQINQPNGLVQPITGEL